MTATSGRDKGRKDSRGYVYVQGRNDGLHFHWINLPARAGNQPSCATLYVDISARVLAALVSRPEVAVMEFLGRQFGLAEVSVGGSRTSDRDLSRLARRDGEPLFAKNLDGNVLQRQAD